MIRAPQVQPGWGDFLEEEGVLGGHYDMLVLVELWGRNQGTLLSQAGESPFRELVFPEGNSLVTSGYKFWMS